MQKQKRHSGFTLTEILVAVSILGLLAALAVPSFTSVLERREIVSAAETILADFHWARSEAIKRNADVTVTFAPGAGGVWAYNISPGDRTVNSATVGEYAAITLAVTFANGDTTFDRVRGTADDTGSVILTSATGQYELQVRVAALGRARICRQAAKKEIGGYGTC